MIKSNYTNLYSSKKYTNKYKMLKKRIKIFQKFPNKDIINVYKMIKASYANLDGCRKFIGKYEIRK